MGGDRDPHLEAVTGLGFQDSQRTKHMKARHRSDDG